VGQRASILKSNRHEPEFYHQMWETLLANGFWQGEIWNRRKDGAVYPAFLSIISLRNEAGETTHHIGSLQDISFMKASEERIRYLAYHDPLTGLPNRLLFVDRLNLAIQQAKRDGTKLAVIILDLDGFKKVNDTLGHPVGDLLLVEVARRLSENIRAEDTVARLGGDEFIILLPRIRQEEAVLLVVRKVLSWLGRPMELKGHELVVSASLGVSLYPGDGTTYEDLLKAADIAMYRVKESGKSGYQIYSREMDQIMRRRVELENRLRQALARKEFRLFYQPRHDLRTGQIRGAEALVRWVQPEGIIPPQDFIPIAEETGLILPLGEWILTEACRQARAWSRLRDGDMAVSVNISPFQIRRPEFGPEVERILAETGADPRCLEMEITEGIFIHDFVEVARTIARLNGLGIRFSLDDFGTGYSSLYYLKRLPIQTLKIDRSFISDLEHSEDSRVIIDTILSMAEILNLDFVAEGVETRFQAEYFAARNRRGTGQGQGFLFSRPQPPAELEALLGLAPPPPSS
jgi:diguanylate cyclase (GGDEF)-like protein